MENTNKYIDISNLYKNLEVITDTIVDKLLLSKTDNNDNILLNIQTIIEKVFINAAMRVAKNNVSKAAKLLGMNRNTLSKKLKELKNKKT